MKKIASLTLVLGIIGVMLVTPFIAIYIGSDSAVEIVWWISVIGIAIGLGGVTDE